MFSSGKPFTILVFIIYLVANVKILYYVSSMLRLTLGFLFCWVFPFHFSSLIMLCLGGDFFGFIVFQI